MKPKISLIALTLMVLLAAIPSSAIFGPPTKTFKGRVNFIQDSNFTVLVSPTEFVRIMVPNDKRIPSQVQRGVQVEVKAQLRRDGMWHLDKFKKIRLEPSDQP